MFHVVDDKLCFASKRTEAVILLTLETMCGCQDPAPIIIRGKKVALWLLPEVVFLLLALLCLLTPSNPTLM